MNNRWNTSTRVERSSSHHQQKVDSQSASGIDLEEKKDEKRDKTPTNGSKADGAKRGGVRGTTPMNQSIMQLDESPRIVPG